MDIPQDSTLFLKSIFLYNLPPTVNITITAESEEDMANFGFNFDAYLIFMLVVYTLLVVSITLLVDGIISGLVRVIKWCLKSRKGRSSPSTMEAGTENAEK